MLHFAFNTLVFKKHVLKNFKSDFVKSTTNRLTNSFVRSLFILFAASISVQSYAANYPMTVTDGLGNEITLSQAPTKIASLTLFTDEVFLDLVDHSRLSHMTNLASDPTYSNISEKVPTTAKLIDLNVEVLVSDYPDIIFAANWSDAATVKQLKDAGMVVYLVSTPFTMKDIQAEITKLGSILDSEKNARKIITIMDQKLQQAKSDIKYRAFTTLDYSTWGTSSGKNSTYNAILTSAGLLNGVAEFEADNYGQVPMSKELLLELNPEVLFLPSFVWGDVEGANNFKSEVVNDAALSDVNAILHQRIIQLPESLRGTYSQYIADSVTLVVKQLNALQ